MNLIEKKQTERKIRKVDMSIMSFHNTLFCYPILRRLHSKKKAKLNNYLPQSVSFEKLKDQSCLSRLRDFAAQKSKELQTKQRGKEQVPAKRGRF